MSEIILNKGQQEAFNLIVDFLDNKDLYFNLSGEAGSGKSFLIKVILDKLLNNKFIYKILAPTHKALDTLKNNIPEYSKKMDTLARYYCYKSIITDDGEKKSEYNLRNTHEKILIIDECGMINEDIYNIIMKQKIKVIFVGDDCQLNPIDEPNSKIYNLDFGKNQFFLYENERQKGADKKLISFINEVRTNTKNELFDFRKINNEFTTKSTDVFIKSIVEKFGENDDTVVLCYSNAKTSYYNNLIRSILFNKKIEELEKFYLDEDIFFTESSFINKKNYSSGIKYRITYLKIVKKNINNPLCSCKKNIICFIDDNEENEKVNKCDNCFNPTSIKRYKTIEFFEMKLDNNNMFLYKPTNEEEAEKLSSVMKKHKEKCVKNKKAFLWKQFYDFDMLFNLKVSYKYSLSIHKSQASGFTNVFVDAVNVCYCNDWNTRNRLLYTAVSRTRENLLCLN